MPVPHDIFKFRTADDVAESWEGVSPALYKVLWNNIVHVASMSTALSMGDEDDGRDEDGSLARYWDHLTEAQQVELNDLARTRSAAT